CMRCESIEPTRSDKLARRSRAISFRATQKSSSKLTLVLWPPTTIERLITCDFFISAPEVELGPLLRRSRKRFAVWQTQPDSQSGLTGNIIPHGSSVGNVAGKTSSRCSRAPAVTGLKNSVADEFYLWPLWLRLWPEVMPFACISQNFK